jgi:hypothetical protein
MGFFKFILLALPSKERLLGNNVVVPLVSRIEQCSASAITTLQRAAMLSHSSSSLSHIPASAPSLLADLWQRMPFKALDLLLHYYCFDCFDFLLVCLHLLQQALYFLWMGFHPCLYRVLSLYCEFIF